MSRLQEKGARRKGTKKWLHRNMEFYRTREAASVPLSVQKRLSANSLITDNSKSQMKFWKKGRGCSEAPPSPTPPIQDPAPRQRLLPRNCSRRPAGCLRPRKTSQAALSHLPGVLRSCFTLLCLLNLDLLNRFHLAYYFSRGTQ